jgi:hypothetical protein
VAERWNFADVVEVLARRSLRRLRHRNGRHGCLRDWKRWITVPHLMLHRNIINARSRQSIPRLTLSERAKVPIC